MVRMQKGGDTAQSMSHSSDGGFGPERLLAMASNLNSDGFQLLGLQPRSKGLQPVAMALAMAADLIAMASNLAQ